MDPLDFLSDEDLIRFFHCKKTEMSLIEEPKTFLNQLRDYNLVPEDLYKKVMRMKSKERRVDGVYQILDSLENLEKEFVRPFWKCVFQEHIVQKYFVLRNLRNSLLDGSYKSCTELPVPEQASRDKGKSVQIEEKKPKDKTAGIKRKKSTEEAAVQEPGPSCSTPNSKNSRKRLQFTSPLKKGEKAPIWTWDVFKNQLPVTCGSKEGTLHEEKLARGRKSILSQGCWFTPSEFEKSAGKGSCKNWKLSIRCQNVTLQKLIMDGHLQAPRPKRRCVQTKGQSPDISSESSSSSESFSHSSSGTMEESCEEDQEGQNENRATVLEEEDEEEEPGEEEEEEEREPVDLSVFKASSLPVSCGSVSGVLYKQRFTGNLIKSIRTEKAWFTPEEFVKLELTDGLWKKDIMCHGKTIHYLLTKKILYVHSVNCKCEMCCPEDPKNHNNDDVCFICCSGGDLVCCDDCPRAFHNHCHLPALQEKTLGKDWTCTFCLIRLYQTSWNAMEKETALNSPVSGNILRCEYLLLCLYKEDVGRVFTEDPTTTVPSYSRVISNPMWLDRVKIKLKNKRYTTVRAFVKDIRLIFHNSDRFNRDNEFGRLGSRLSRIFELEFLKVFNIT